ncbi:MFS transporter [Leptolyngbya sp. FACHB-671]|nr:MFS transporter [Leptolyngbya sp. FACHB-671]MBD2067368.1 MFS transporter [Leptolyngbya sp. FACHB-671]
MIFVHTIFTSRDALTVNQAKKNVSLLVACQALAMTGSIILFTIAALVGVSLAADKSLATLPLALLQLATMCATIPAALLMRQVGRRLGFMVGVLIGAVGAGLGVLAIFQSSFSLFCLATLVFGCFNGFVGYYRFAAADAATEAFRSQAISFVVSGGIIAAIAGPGLAIWSKDWFVEQSLANELLLNQAASAEYAGCLVMIVILQIAALVLLSGIDIPPLSEQERQKSGRSLGAIAQQPIFIVAVLGSMLGYGVMVMVMTATPLAMVAFDHSFNTAASVIQWHVLGMFVPSLFTGFLIARFGTLRIIFIGAILSSLCIFINLTGTGALHFGFALLLLGIGWNFMFVGSSTLLTQAYAPTERAKTQAMHDFLMFAFVAFATFLSGRLLERFSWAAVNYTGLLMILVVLGALGWFRQQGRAIAKSHSTP